MPCENCNVQFTVFKRKKSCTECRRLFCGNCLIKRKENYILCQRCVIFRRRPVSKIELLKLKPKDLIFFLQSKHISTTGCVEKEELVNLVIAHVNSTDSNLNSPLYSSSNSSTYSFSHNQTNNCTNPTNSQQDPFDTIKLTCQNIFSSFTDKINELNNSATNTRNHIGRRTSGPLSAGTSSSGASHLEARNPAKSNNSHSTVSIKSEDASNVERANTVDNQKPGPSGQKINGTTNRSGFNPNDLSSSTSSFEDLGAALSIETCGNDDNSGRDRGGSFAGGNTSNSSDITDNWQFIQKSSRIVNSTINLPTTSNSDEKSDTLFTLSNKNKLFRRHSDSEVNLNNHAIDHFVSQHHKRLKKGCCLECTQTRSDLKKIIRNFRQQMNGRQINLLSDHDKAIRMNEFIRSIENHCTFNNQSDLEFIELQNPATCPILSSSHNNQVAIPISPTSPLNNTANDNDDEGIYIYPTIHFMFDEHSNNNKFPNGKPSYRMKLTDITSKSELKDLSVKQLKEILMLNRVDFKGCCEKTELLERVYRLWREHKSTPAVEKLSTDDLCKICMDAPIECVILECGHMVTCTNCGKVLNECPICRQYIVRVVRFFRA